MSFRYPQIQLTKFLRVSSRYFATEAAALGETYGLSRVAKPEGTIASVFTSLSGEKPPELPKRFSDLKRDLWKDEMIESWRQILVELENKLAEVAEKGSELIPRIPYTDIVNGLSEEQVNTIRRVGSVVITEGVPQDEALAWKQLVRDYVVANKERVKGFPDDDMQVFEIYNSKSQTLARTHPAVLNTQRALLSLWHTSTPSSPIGLSHPISYFDRLRLRKPGDMKFALGPHIDGGSLERWEDPGYRQCFKKILEGGSAWRQHDPFDATPRLTSKTDLYRGPSQCSVFRSFQGWTSLSSTGPGEGTLRVLPFLPLSTAYIILRPFFSPRPGAPVGTLKFDDWRVDLESTEFPGSLMGKAQELYEDTHPHLALSRTMVSMPRVEPGDQVYWHCDTVHAVEAEHRGKGDSSVLYIPATPLTLHNANYLRDQRINFLRGLPAPDFPGGEGESQFVGRGTDSDILSVEGRRALGLEPFLPSSESETSLIKQINGILF